MLGGVFRARGAAPAWQLERTPEELAKARGDATRDVSERSGLKNTWEPGVPLEETIAAVVRRVAINVAADLGWPAPEKPPRFVIQSQADAYFQRTLSSGIMGFSAGAALMPGTRAAFAGATPSIEQERREQTVVMEWDTVEKLARVSPLQLERFLEKPLAEFAATVHHELVHEAQDRRFPDFCALAAAGRFTKDQVLARMSLIEGHARYVEDGARERHYGLAALKREERPPPRRSGLLATLGLVDWRQVQYAAGVRVVRAVREQRPDLLERLYQFPWLTELALMTEGRVRIDLPALRAAGLAEPEAAVALLMGLNPHLGRLSVDLVH